MLKLRRQFHRLVETAAEEGIDIVMTTAYRSYEFQQILWDNYVAQKGEEEANKTSARPGESDIRRTGGGSLHVGNRLPEFFRFCRYSGGSMGCGNAHKSDLFCAFRKIRRISRVILTNRGIFCYVGLTAAADIYEENLTLEEYLEQLEL